MIHADRRWSGGFSGVGGRFVVVGGRVMKAPGRPGGAIAFRSGVIAFASHTRCGCSSGNMCVGAYVRVC